jgi:glycosyltransferase involved in cell wall biosynthesis
LIATPKPLLLLSGSPPGTGKVGEIILRDLVAYYGAEQTHCIAIPSPRYAWTPGPASDGMSVHVLPSIHVNAQRWGGGGWGAAESYFNFQIGFRREVARLVEQVVAQARERRVERVFAVLNNALMMMVARRVARKLAVPLVALVWDPPEYLLGTARFDRFSRKALLREFKSSLAASSAVAVVSETMQHDYAAWTAAPIHILRYGLPGEEDAMTKEPPRDGEEWLIGFAGSMYSDCAWKALLRALDSVGWRIAGRSVRLRLLTAKITLASRHAAQIEFLGFRPAAEAQEILRSCHINYMPQPFVAHLRELCRYAFPTKLGNYLALGRPVLVHGPEEGALSQFYERHPMGARATSLEPGPIVDALEGLLGDEETYRQACEGARRTAQEHFDVSVFRAAIDRLLRPATTTESARA